MCCFFGEAIERLARKPTYSTVCGLSIAFWITILSVGAFFTANVFSIIGGVINLIILARCCKNETTMGLARCSFLFQFFGFIVILLVMVLLFAGTIYTYAIGAHVPKLYIVFIATPLAVIFQWWLLHLTRSFYRIVEAGGTGWESQSAEEILKKKGETDPLLSSTTAQP